MNLRTILLAACVTLCIPLNGRADDKLVAIDAANQLLTVEQHGTLKSFKAKKFTEITLNGAKATFDQLRPGMMVTFALSDPQTVAKVTARGNPGQPVAPAAGPAMTQLPKVAGGVSNVPAGTAKRVTVKLYVDGSDVIKIGGGRLWIEHGSAKKPKDITVDGMNWEPTWKGNTSEPFTGFAPGLAPFGTGKISVKQTAGRGETTVIEPPTAENQQTLSFRIQDGGSGGDVHDVRVTW